MTEPTPRPSRRRRRRGRPSKGPTLFLHARIRAGLLRQAKRHAAGLGVTLTALVERLLEDVITSEK